VPHLLYLLAACNLVIGTGAFSLAGILQPVAQSLQVSVGVAGQSMTAYAMASALLAPMLLMGTGRWERRAALQLALTIYAAGLLLCAWAPSLQVLLIGRVLMGTGAVFTPISASIAVSVVEPALRGKALSVTFLGMSLSYVIGLPLSAWLGLNFGWRVPTAVIAACTLLMLALVSLRMPRRINAPGASLSGLGEVLRQGEVLRSLGLTLMYFSAIFTVFSYSGPVLLALYPMSPEMLSLTLMLFGLAGVTGTLTGGWANDRFGALPTLRCQLAMLALMMALAPLTAGSYLAMMAVFMVWGTSGFGMMAPTQARLAAVSMRQAPVLFSLNTSMLYFGTAFGAALGGAASVSVGFSRLPWVGLVFALLGGLSFWGGRRR
jgi:DHA1 family inner membrane transport protein